MYDPSVKPGLTYILGEPCPVKGCRLILHEIVITEGRCFVLREITCGQHTIPTILPKEKS